VAGLELRRTNAFPEDAVSAVLCQTFAGATKKRIPTVQQLSQQKDRNAAGLELLQTSALPEDAATTVKYQT